eukprot:5653687-Pleurochrysis_carterae.AAC.1
MTPPAPRQHSPMSNLLRWRWRRHHARVKGNGARQRVRIICPRRGPVTVAESHVTDAHSTVLSTVLCIDAVFPYDDIQ